MVLLESAARPGALITDTLRGLKGQVSVQEKAAEDGVAVFELRSAEDADVREEVGHAISAKGWPIRRLERKSRAALADAFFDVLRVQDPLKAPPQESGVKSQEAAVKNQESAAPASASHESAIKKPD